MAIDCITFSLLLKIYVSSHKQEKPEPNITEKCQSHWAFYTWKVCIFYNFHISLSKAAKQ